MESGSGSSSAAAAAFNIGKANRSGTFSQDRYRAALAGIENLLQSKGVR